MSSIHIFRDRPDAGEKLARVILSNFCHEKLTRDWPLNPIVYALPRGGLPVAVPVARRLGCPLSVVVAKKITLPSNPELALGAITADGCIVWSKQKPRSLRVQYALIEKAQEKALSQLEKLSAGKAEISSLDRLVILVDDGIATGMTMIAAVKSIQLQKPNAVWICVPVAPPELLQPLRKCCDRLIVLETPNPFLSVSRFYNEFAQVETEVALACLQQQGEWL
ncbi:MAG: phosphoribosyltransferase [Okeania sp. SIO2F4]|uniref:phosphoribosyltransferase n=1 Tax=Okeania sp. SIO2F4 TaxID=2607790 RepID=UPI00142C52DC|nr:phosphoribosyltransferase family protein [Okeania sp. SIO2F4]NES03557.1 phosphoribosyltransferase [Okeania sp. SIO2F4]